MSDADWILSVVESFYAKAKIDVLIGYHFRNVKDFDEHIPRIASFWDLRLLGKTNRNFGKPFDLMSVHTALPIKPGELGRWMVLFRRTLDEKLTETPEKSSLAKEWREKLVQFEGIFSRFFTVQNP